MVIHYSVIRRLLNKPFPGCEPLVAGQLFRRLENEGGWIIFLSSHTDLSLLTILLGFISLENVDGALEETANTSKSSKSRKGKSQQKRAPRRRTMQKQRYVFNRQIIEERVYKDYFDYSPEVEKRLLGLEELVRL